MGSMVTNIKNVGNDTFIVTVKDANGRIVYEGGPLSLTDVTEKLDEKLYGGPEKQ